jgi:hypothetical protein
MLYFDKRLIDGASPLSPEYGTSCVPFPAKFAGSLLRSAFSALMMTARNAGPRIVLVLVLVIELLTLLGRSASLGGNRREQRQRQTSFGTKSPGGARERSRPRGRERLGRLKRGDSL